MTFMDTSRDNLGSSREPRAHRFVDMQLPLWGILSAIGAAIVFTSTIGFTLWFTLQQLVEKTGEMRSILQAVSTQQSSQREDLSIIKWRLDSLESAGRSRQDSQQSTPPYANGRR